MNNGYETGYKELKDALTKLLKLNMEIIKSNATRENRCMNDLEYGEYTGYLNILDLLS